MFAPALSDFPAADALIARHIMQRHVSPHSALVIKKNILHFTLKTYQLKLVNTILYRLTNKLSSTADPILGNHMCGPSYTVIELHLPIHKWSIFLSHMHVLVYSSESNKAASALHTKWSMLCNQRHVLVYSPESDRASCICPPHKMVNAL